MTEHNKRARPRLIVTEDVLVRHAETQALLGKLANIHEEGFMVIGEHMHADGTYPLLLETALAPIRCSAECLWTSSTGSGNHLWAGFSFVDIHPEDQDILYRLIKLFQP